MTEENNGVAQKFLFEEAEPIRGVLAHASDSLDKIERILFAIAPRYLTKCGNTVKISLLL